MSEPAIVKRAVWIDSSSVGTGHEVTWTAVEYDDGTFAVLDPDDGDAVWETFSSAGDLDIWLTDEECVPIEEREEHLRQTQ